MEDLKNILAEHPFFKGLNEEYFALIVGCASNIRVDAGNMIHREGEEANHFYLIRSGKVTLQMMTPNKGPIIIETLTEGVIFSVGRGLCRPIHGTLMQERWISRA